MRFNEEVEMNMQAKEMMEAASAEWEELQRFILEEAWIQEKSRE